MFEGYDYFDFTRYGLVWTDESNFSQGQAVTGVYDGTGYLQERAMLLFNSAFGVARFSTAGYVGATMNTGHVSFGFHAAPINTTGGAWGTQIEFLQLSTIIGDQRYRSLVFAITADRRLLLYNGGLDGTPFSGSEIYRSAPNFFPVPASNIFVPFHHYEFRINATALTVTILRDGVVYAALSGLQIWTGASVYNQLSHMLQNFGQSGVCLDNLYCMPVAESGNIGIGRVTTAWIMPYLLGDVQTAGWVTAWGYSGSYGLPEVGGVLRDYNTNPWGPTYPDTDDKSRVLGTGVALFKISLCPPVGTIQGLAICVCVKRTTANVTQIRGIVRKGATSMYSSWQTIGDSYKVLRFYWRLDPFTGERWNEQDFVSSAFDFGWESDDQVSVSQITVTRLHTVVPGGLRGVYASSRLVG